ncbi:MAG: hypothetical protein USCAAHI_00135 [Beijerinckiaceae bacterium]|nr:MAG: hypothetical protein USCAAHI_00135 [Beijerinckiaceae bacterium]
MQGYGWALLVGPEDAWDRFELRSTKAVRLRSFAMLANLLSDRGQEHRPPSSDEAPRRSLCGEGFFIYAA